MDPKNKKHEESPELGEVNPPETITQAIQADKEKKPAKAMKPVKDGFIRYSAPGGIQSLNNESGHYPVVDGIVDLPVNHSFWVLVGSVIFETEQ